MSGKSFLVTVLFTFLVWMANGQTPVSENGFLGVQGVHLVNQQGQPVALHGVSYGWHNFWPRFYNPASVNWLAEDWHVSVVRAAIGVELKGGYMDNPREAFRAAEAIIQGAIHSGIYVIVDWHSHNINLKEAETFFAYFARKYNDCPNIIYEIFNEPDAETWPQVKAYAEKVIAVIRGYDKRNVILVGCPHWDQDINLPAADPIKGFNNIMYTLHFYAATHKEKLRARCDLAIARGLPVFISECAGMEASGDGKLNFAQWHQWIRWADKRKISWVTWSVSDKAETCSMLKKSADSAGHWQQKDLKRSGIHTKMLLKKYYSARHF